jgi:hypothetical protein
MGIEDQNINLISSNIINANTNGYKSRPSSGERKETRILAYFGNHLHWIRIFVSRGFLHIARIYSRLWQFYAYYDLPFPDIQVQPIAGKNPID